MQESLQITLMNKLLPLLTVVIFAGCASNQEFQYTPQYCYTDQTITKTDGSTVSSRTVLECTDRPGQQMQIARAGIDKGCKEFWYTEIRNGNRIKTRGVQCEKPDGTWEILNIYGTVK